ncbi:MAG: GTPase domain-containing protein [Planctomycetaceae bacterium]|nr:GTPase domain-containing protein [Planctomycetaceae bacterium]
MNSHSELEQIAVLAEVDDLTQRTQQWISDCPDWPPARKARNLVGRVLNRVESLRIRLQSPLVVATFGGTGTGKSSLVNALVGEEVTTAGRQRPTTTIPILLVHPSIDASALGLDLSRFHLKTVDSPVLKELVLIDCPDPDTSETAGTGTNLALLRSIVPHCDVLIYVSTQQKYRSARVVDELADVATGCRLVFVQTHADVDSDIRDDWKNVLSGQWQVPDMFFVDSRLALQEQKQGHQPGGDFGRLVELLTHQLGASRRVAIRRANVADLLEEALNIAQADYRNALPAVEKLQIALDEQRTRLRDTLNKQLTDELLLNRHLWERRLLSAVTDMWGFSPFSTVLRLYNGLGAFIASFSFFRARTSAQMALIGAMQGARWLKSRAQEQEADLNLDRLSTFGISDQELHESRVVVSGYVRAAGLPQTAAVESRHDLAVLRTQAATLESEFLLDARRGIDLLIEELAASHCGWLTRARYETLFLLYVVFLIARIGHNFFWSSFLKPLVSDAGHSEPLLTIDFYVPAMIFLLLWSGVLVLGFTWRLRRGLTARIRQLAQSMADVRLVNGLFPGLESEVHRVKQDQQQLAKLAEQTSSFRRRLADSASFLGGRG